LIMRLYLREDLAKSENSDKPAAPSKSGEQRGGAYVARAQVGTEADGSPRYRYFKTQEEYDSFLGSKKKESSSGKKLEEKVEKEHEESTKKQHHSNLLSPKDSQKTEKSLRLFVRG